VQKWLIEKTRLGIPAIFHDEILHAHMARGSTSFPQPLALASTWDPDFIARVFTAGALETRARGSQQVLGPNLDLAREPRWGRTEETFGEDPYLVSRMAVAIVKGLQGPGPNINGETRQLPRQSTLPLMANRKAARTSLPANYSERVLREIFLAQLQNGRDRRRHHERNGFLQRD